VPKANKKSCSIGICCVCGWLISCGTAKQVYIGGMIATRVNLRHLF